ncbi:MAG TPA: cupin domain-containing protein [Rhodopila sp.]|nr:cupin domain-containing protein [Rhodopila sp.]
MAALSSSAAMTGGYENESQKAVLSPLQPDEHECHRRQCAGAHSGKEATMTTPPKSRYAPVRNAVAAAAGLIAIAGLTPAFAGSCPADKVVPSGHGQAMSNLPAKGVTDTVIASTELAKEPVGINDRLFRLRKLVVEPGGVVPWHSHGDRPALIYIVSGEITEYASTCAVPIVHKAGDSTPETHRTSHWWKNTGTEQVVLLSADLFRTKDDPHMM